jgi:hypothetical protein
MGEPIIKTAALKHDRQTPERGLSERVEPFNILSRLKIFLTL